MKLFRRVARGFTIVELLVVTTLISILVALMMPALHAVRARMQSDQCMKNLKLIGLCFPLAAADNRGRFPGVGMGWYSVVAPYIRPGLTAAQYNQFGPAQLISAFDCPTTMVNVTYDGNGSGPRRFDYALNNAGVGTIPRFIVDSSKVLLVCTSGVMEYPGGINSNRQISWFTSGGGAWQNFLKVSQGGGVNPIYRMNPSGTDASFPFYDGGAGGHRPSYAHKGGVGGQGGANLLFCDGHVTWYSQDVLQPGFKLGYKEYGNSPAPYDVFAPSLGWAR